MNKWVHNLLNTLSDKEQDAMVEIGITAHMLAGHGGYRMFLYGEIPGCGISDSAGHMITLRRRFREWAKELMRQEPEALGVCIAVCTEEISIYSLEKSKRMRSLKIKSLLREGLEVWIKIARWK